MPKPVIFSCPITGSINLPSMSPHLPITPAQIASEAISAAQAGAAIVHLRVRDPTNGGPTADPAVYQQFLRWINAGCDAYRNPAGFLYRRNQARRQPVARGADCGGAGVISTARKLFGDDFEWSVWGAGNKQMPMATQYILLGGNSWVGLEDSLYLDRGRLAVSNADQAERIKSILHLLGCDVATPAQARHRLVLKSAGETRF